MAKKAAWERAASIAPSPRQLAWQQLEFYAFIHFGVNTFTDSEWGDGMEQPDVFFPEALDTRQWAREIKNAGMRGIILTCKHHDGFCLWPSRYTDHCVRASKWRGGQGNVVREVAEACRAEGLRFGVYLSPWDRHEKTYGSGRKYDDFFVHQLEELAGDYGDIFCFWFDGACGEGADGRKQYYDWERYYATIRRLQPGAVISVCGPDVRWCGNEAGHCRPSEWSVVPAQLRDAERIASLSQQADDRAFARLVRSEEEDLGSRKAIREKKELVWYPAEVNTSIRPGWFYHSAEDAQVRTPEELFDIYLKSVGGNAAFLLNIPPDRRGLLADADVQCLRTLGNYVRDLQQGPGMAADRIMADTWMEEHPVEMALDDGENNWWQAERGHETACITLHFAEKIQVRYVTLMEQLTVGQRIEAGEILLDGTHAADFTVVGHKRICSIEAREASTVTIRITASRLEPTLQFICVQG